MTDDTSKKLTEDRVVHSKEYMHKDLPDGTEVCLLKHPLTIDEWDQILRNQEMLEKLKEFLSDPLNDPESHSIVFHNKEYGKFLKEILDG